MNSYLFKVPQPESRRIEVELSVDPRGAHALDVRMPVWTPGSYLVREHQRHVDGLRAWEEPGSAGRRAEGLGPGALEAGDRELPVEKIDKHTWRVRCDGARTVRVQYRLHCFELTVRTNHVDGSHAFFKGRALHGAPLDARGLARLGGAAFAGRRVPRPRLRRAGRHPF